MADTAKDKDVSHQEEEEEEVETTTTTTTTKKTSQWHKTRTTKVSKFPLPNISTPKF
uniref:GG11760 n=1 Tax=Drosophila erecta TaxID=7220 RepID=B3P568_DROER